MAAGGAECDDRQGKLLRMWRLHTREHHQCDVLDSDSDNNDKKDREAMAAGMKGLI